MRHTVERVTHFFSLRLFSWYTASSFNPHKSCVNSHFSTIHERHVSYLSHCASMKTWRGWDRTGWAVPAGQMAVVRCCDLWPLLRGCHQIPHSLMGWYNSPKPDRDTECIITHPNRCKILISFVLFRWTCTCKRQVTCSSSRRCLVKACSTSQPDAVEPVPKPVPLAQYSCCSSVVPPTCPLEAWGCRKHTGVDL